MSYLTVRDVAARWGVPERRVVALSDAGVIPTLRVSIYRRFKPEWIGATAPEIPRPERAAPALPLVGVYLLYRDGALTYIGRSTELPRRITNHRRAGRLFDDVRAIPCDAPTADWLEAELIRTLRPPENIKRFERRAKRIEAALAALN